MKLIRMDGMKIYKFLLFTATIIPLLQGGESAVVQFPCDHRLRLSFPDLFLHCNTAECFYSDWTNWEMVPNSVVSSASCASREAFREKRTRSALGCEDETETKLICLPPQTERLINALGLGRTSGAPVQPLIPAPGLPGPNISPARPGLPGPNISPARPGLPGPNISPVRPYINIPSPNLLAIPIQLNSTFLHPHYRRQLPSTTPNCPIIQRGEGQQICHRFTTPIGKRGLSDDNAEDHAQESKFEDLMDETAIPFVWEEHGHRFRRTTCSDSTKYVLFVLDKSGSVQEINFEKMKTAIRELIPLFCDSIRTAVITFDHEYFLEYCFDCFGDQLADRGNAQMAVMDIPYGDGGHTHTGGAATCACYDVLNSECGLPVDTRCIDVIFITDGLSNDPTRDICQEIDCVKSRPGVTTHAIGIGQGDRRSELDCISSNVANAFNFNDLDEFLEKIREVKAMIYKGANSGNLDGCANPFTYNPNG